MAESGSLEPSLQMAAQRYQHLHDAAMPPGMWNPADQRHMAGAFQDNRVIPYEGIKGADINTAQWT
ncbi:hypothetical protein N7462_011213 [Penicillium macrosclerotiorum]|uniref:uncharacterized protein n=1 Tax=Penicillium macrosclerotiorum TaxID=303699 RepID=UPI002549A013|nr:uncharacterized protein N7462_011213 [Penicillium macrosclerotiorum]KAJ5666804.1 hypothetical protein N7462_011213 [Penicillium macrosclerotiorum]